MTTTIRAIRLARGALDRAVAGAKDAKTRMPTMRIRRGWSGSRLELFTWPWLHWCLFDRECRSHGAPRRLYVHVLNLYIDIEFPGDVDRWRFADEPVEDRDAQ